MDRKRPGKSSDLLEDLLGVVRSEVNTIAQLGGSVEAQPDDLAQKSSNQLPCTLVADTALGVAELQGQPGKRLPKIRHCITDRRPVKQGACSWS